jgi:hypothetical protein
VLQHLIAASQYFYCVAPRHTLYLACIKTAVALPVRMTAAGRLSLSMDRLWAQIRAMPDHRPKGQFHD